MDKELRKEDEKQKIIIQLQHDMYAVMTKRDKVTTDKEYNMLSEKYSEMDDGLHKLMGWGRYKVAMKTSVTNIIQVVIQEVYTWEMVFISQKMKVGIRW